LRVFLHVRWPYRCHRFMWGRSGRFVLILRFHGLRCRCAIAQGGYGWADVEGEVFNFDPPEPNHGWLAVRLLSEFESYGASISSCCCGFCYDGSWSGCRSRCRSGCRGRHDYWLDFSRDVRAGHEAKAETRNHATTGANVVRTGNERISNFLRSVRELLCQFGKPRAMSWLVGFMK